MRPCDVCRELRSPAPATAAAGAGLGFLLSAVPRQLPVSTLYTPGTWRQVAARPHTPAPHHATTPWESYLDWTHILVWIPETKPYFYTYLLTLT